jgi:dihydroorotate dehydrogenase electron transfer subunit
MSTQKINKSAMQMQAEVISNKKAGPYNHIVFAVGEMAANSRPGNFVAISIGGEASSLILRRAFAIYRATDKGVMGGTMLIGGGYGSAPLFALAEVLKNRGCRVDMVLGASTASKIYAPLEGKRSVSSLTLTTDDGSTGIHGQISEAIPRLLREFGTEVIYSCGPMGMLAAVAKIAEEFDIAHQCAVEEAMACGIGVCMTCVVPIKDPSGVKMVRTCIDGPVMDGSQIIWDKKDVLDHL